MEILMECGRGWGTGSEVVWCGRVVSKWYIFTRLITRSHPHSPRVLPLPASASVWAANFLTFSFVLIVAVASSHGKFSFCHPVSPFHYDSCLNEAYLSIYPSILFVYTAICIYLSLSISIFYMCLYLYFKCSPLTSHSLTTSNSLPK